MYRFVSLSYVGMGSFDDDEAAFLPKTPNACAEEANARAIAATSWREAILVMVLRLVGWCSAVNHREEGGRRADAASNSYVEIVVDAGMYVFCSASRG